jgi:hypothetical protein
MQHPLLEDKLQHTAGYPLQKLLMCAAMKRCLLAVFARREFRFMSHHTVGLSLTAQWQNVQDSCYTMAVTDLTHLFCPSCGVEKSYISSLHDD